MTIIVIIIIIIVIIIILPSYRVFTIVYLKQTMFLDCILLQIFRGSKFGTCNVIFHLNLYIIFLTAVRAQCLTWLLSVVTCCNFHVCCSDIVLMIYWWFQLFLHYKSNNNNYYNYIEY